MQFISDLFYFSTKYCIDWAEGSLAVQLHIPQSVILTAVNMKCGQISLVDGLGVLTKFLIDKQHFFISNNVIFCSL